MVDPTSQLVLHGARTGNCLRAAIGLNEAGLSYSVRVVDLRGREHLRSPYLALNPNGKVPTLTGQTLRQMPFVLTQSNAILFYAEALSPGRLLPLIGDPARDEVLAVYFHFVTDVIVPAGDSFMLRGHGFAEASSLLEMRLVEAIGFSERFLNETRLRHAPPHPTFAGAHMPA